MTIRFHAALLVPGRGEPVRDGVVVVDDGTVTYAGPAATAPATPEAETVTAPTVMPGLWECHGHFLGARTLDFSRLPLEPVPVRAARAAAALRSALDAGVTSVREVGGLGRHLVPAIAEGLLAGPRIYHAGSILSATGGHGDLHGYPLPWVHDFGAAHGGELRLADGPAEFARATREQLRGDAKVIKVCASGGVLSEIDHPIHQQLTDAELRAIVEVAGMADRVVAAHCHGKPGMMAALAAGVHTIEHGTYLDEEAAAAMRERGAILVPTRTIMAEILESKAAPEFALAKLTALADQHAAATALAREAGVTVAMGTDLALSGTDLPVSWGRNGRELPLLAECGFTALEAIEAATANGPATLGPQAPRSGQLQPGYDADLLTVDGDPVADLALLADPTKITGVWQSGVRVKG